MKIFHLSSGPLRVNTYFLVNEEKNTAVVIDSGENYKLIKKAEEENGFIIKAVLLTHAHFDHAGNVKKLQDDGAKIYVSDIDAKKLLNDDNLASSFGRRFDYCTADFTFVDGNILNIEDIKIEVIATPGHTDGSVTFKVEDNLFTGDTLFLESVGRTDFPTGNKGELIRSVTKLFNLEGDYKVYPGHQEFTTLSHERKNNFFIDYD